MAIFRLRLRFRIPRLPLRVLVFAVLVIAAIVFVKITRATETVFSQRDCVGWVPIDPTTDHKCPASTRLRQVQALLDEPHDDTIYNGLRRLEACGLGLVECLDRPLIVSLWPDILPDESFFVEVERLAQLAWRDDIAKAIKVFKYVFIPVYDRKTALYLVKALESSIHQVWMGEKDAIECMQNPHCIGEDYIKSFDPEMVSNSGSKAERGPVDLWRLMVTSWLGARPSRAQSPGHDLTLDWGVATKGGEENWSIHPLGRWHIISPYAFPDHAWVPFIHSRACDPSTFNIVQKPKHRGAKRTVLILGDGLYLDKPNWGRVWLFLHERGYDVTFTIPSGPGNGWIKAISIHPESYPDLLGDVDVLLGIGGPHIPTTPYIAMCRGTPTVFPSMRDLSGMGMLEGWERFDPSWTQHGQYFVDEPEPYGFKYLWGNDEQLAYALWKALESGKTPQYGFIGITVADISTPRQFGPLGLYESLEAVLNYDYEDEYRSQREERGGPIGLPDDLRVNCWKKRWCTKDKDG